MAPSLVKQMISSISTSFEKIISLSFRLFGNIFAGEVLGAVVLFLAPFFVPLPFLFLSLV
jgi:F-type H+-transporting ATPase subunit a